MRRRLLATENWKRALRAVVLFVALHHDGPHVIEEHADVVHVLRAVAAIRGAVAR